MATAGTAEILGPVIPEWQLLRRSLPSKPEVPALTGRFVELRPFDADDHLPTLILALNGEAYCGHPTYDPVSVIWKYMRGFTANGEAMNSALREYILRIRDTIDARLFVVVESESNRVIGMTALLGNRPADLVIEIGAIAFTPAFQATPANTEATALLCRWAFEQGYRRVEWKCNSQNERSKAAALRIGFTFEGNLPLSHGCCGQTWPGYSVGIL
jgi:RimJ/RimL family protein N-acetyltransferase